MSRHVRKDVVPICMSYTAASSSAGDECASLWVTLRYTSCCNDACVDETLIRATEEKVNGWMNGWMDGWMDE